MLNVLCLYAGTGYDISYVRNLKLSLDKCLDTEHRFYILTDRLDQRTELETLGQIIVLPKLDVKKLWWYKCWMFSSEINLTGTCLYFDLDVLILKSLDKFIARDKEFKIIHDFNRSNTNNYNYSNSSIMSWTAGQQTQIWTRFSSESRSVQASMHGDQDFIHVHAQNLSWYPDDWAISFKWEYKLKKLYTPQTSVIVFHGKPKPQEITDSFLQRFWLG